jgi:ABC-2 type transport system permease protein
VTLSLKASKLAVDSAGTETKLPMQEWVEIGVFAAAKQGEEKGKLLYLQKHLIKAGQQALTVTVPSKPAQAAINPNDLLIDWNITDNYKKVQMAASLRRGWVRAGRASVGSRHFSTMVTKAKHSKYPRQQ